jgi:hypothetical protein
LPKTGSVKTKTIGILRTRKIGAYDVITFNRSKDDEAQESILSHLNDIKAGRVELVNPRNETEKRAV